jgi:hypothetical protein
VCSDDYEKLSGACIRGEWLDFVETHAFYSSLGETFDVRRIVYKVSKRYDYLAVMAIPD